MNDLYYAGIGSRETPDHILAQMFQIGAILRDNGFILRSGHADGADKTFEQASNGKNQIFLPWKGFGGSGTNGFPTAGHYSDPSTEMNYVAACIAENYHPNWAACTEAARKLHARNVYQVLGPGLGFVQHESISKFIVCWTKDGKASGGTGQALRIAEGYNIPVFNLFHADAIERMEDHIAELRAS